MERDGEERVRGRRWEEMGEARGKCLTCAYFVARYCAACRQGVTRLRNHGQHVRI